MRHLVATPSYRRDWKRLQAPVQAKVRQELLLLSAADFPFKGFDIAKMAGSRPVALRLRVGDYRVVFRFDGMMIVLLAVDHRKDVYR